MDVVPVVVPQTQQAVHLEKVKKDAFMLVLELHDTLGLPHNDDDVFQKLYCYYTN